MPMIPPLSLIRRKANAWARSQSSEEMHPGAARACLLAPCDVQAIKASGVTFARSMIERVIDERTAGEAARADAIRARIGSLIGDNLANVRAGSDAAQPWATVRWWG